MATTNPITGDLLISKINTPEFEDNFDRIFGKKKTNGGWTPPPIDPSAVYEKEELLNKQLEGD
jgi:hypothetical protein